LANDIEHHDTKHNDTENNKTQHKGAEHKIHSEYNDIILTVVILVVVCA
jgi:hypothetical protein